MSWTSRSPRCRSNGFVRAAKRSTKSWKRSGRVASRRSALTFVLVGADDVLRGRHRIIRQAVVVHARSVRIARLLVARPITFDRALVHVLIVLLLGRHRRHVCPLALPGPRPLR